MSKIVFRNYNKVAIKQLLKEIGQERYLAALEDAKISQKPLSMNGFFVEYEVDAKDVNLYFKYPSRIEVLIMSVLGYWAVPQDSWELLRKD